MISTRDIIKKPNQLLYNKYHIEKAKLHKYIVELENKNEEVIVKRTEEGELVVTSRQVAEDFGKEHKNVVRAIENLTAQNSAVKNIVIKSTFEHRGSSLSK